MKKPEWKDCVSLSLCRRTFKLKDNKKFRTWTKKSEVFFVFRDSYVLCYIYMNILCSFRISISVYGTLRCPSMYVCMYVCIFLVSKIKVFKDPLRLKNIPHLEELSTQAAMLVCCVIFTTWRNALSCSKITFCLPSLTIYFLYFNAPFKRANYSHYRFIVTFRFGSSNLFYIIKEIHLCVWLPAWNCARLLLDLIFRNFVFKKSLVKNKWSKLWLLSQP